VIRRRRPLLAPLFALLVGGAGLGAAVPWTARAQTDPASVCQDLTPQDDLAVQVCTPPDGQSSAPDVPLQITVANQAWRTQLHQSHYNVTTITAEVLATADGQEPADPPKASWSGPPAATGTLDWTPAFTTNGRYDLHVVATGDRPTSGQRADVTVPLTLVVPPHQPTDVATTVTGGKVAVSWAIDDREPDLLSYEVSRAAQGSADFARIEFVAATTDQVVDAPPSGAWKYRVTAVRRGATATEGIASVPSRDATAEVSPAAAETTTGSGSGTTGTGTGSGTGTGGTTAAGNGSGTTSSTVARPSISNAPRSTIDLSVLGSARRTTPTTRRPAEPDPGFQELLPFDTKEAADTQEEPQELGADDPEVALGERIVSDTGERRRSLGFVAGGLLLFVLGMTGLFLKSEVKRADELDPLDPEAPLDPLVAAVAPVAAGVTAAEEPAPLLPGRRHRSRPALPGPEEDAAWASAPEDGGTDEVEAVEPAAVGVASRRGVLRRTRPATVADPAAMDEPSGRAEDVAAAPDVTVPDLEPVLVEEAAARPAESTTAVRSVGEWVAAQDPSDSSALEATTTDTLPTAPSPISRLARARQARAERAAEIAELFAGEDLTTAADDDAHLASLAAAQWQDAPAVPTGTHRQVRRTVPAVDDPSLDVPDPGTTARRRPTPAGAKTTRTSTSKAATPRTKAASPRKTAAPARKTTPTATPTGKATAGATKRAAPAKKATAPTSAAARKTTGTAAPTKRTAATTTRTTTHARRAPTRVPSRPADDRRQGGAAVRPGGRGAGEGDRRLPVRRS
jgi:hypothetical protein